MLVFQPSMLFDEHKLSFFIIIDISDGG